MERIFLACEEKDLVLTGRLEDRFRGSPLSPLVETDQEVIKNEREGL